MLITWIIYGFASNKPSCFGVGVAYVLFGFENDDHSPYELIWFVKMMIRLPMMLYGFYMVCMFYI